MPATSGLTPARTLPIRGSCWHRPEQRPGLQSIAPPAVRFAGDLLKLLELRNPHLPIRNNGADLQLTTERLNIVGQRAEVDVGPVLDLFLDTSPWFTPGASSRSHSAARHLWQRWHCGRCAFWKLRAPLIAQGFSPIHRIKNLCQRAIACNERRHTWQPWQTRQRGICKLQIQFVRQVSESLSLRQTIVNKQLTY